ncbi:MAG: hypothetical protein NBKEAIPA_03070 [Nitrospirae bacterium]|nr:MAG: hypothetical protein UZ03_NOB001000885 [Nitrospira sp. OLB3]MBV6471143.1 hypothetical protein [Nitrospirota bacterium]MCE7966724.1 hypothetical protein [Nitrospira sp. NTP2]MCK6494575.1 hypothetical protein [Nitrospira sp.]MEB2338646.1 hypothetical protein [Nitrospirales bacterium]
MVKSGERPRRWTLALASAALSLTLLLLLLELLFRWLPVNEGLRGLSVDEQNPVFRFTPHRESVYSRGWNFSIVNRVRTNNYGFVNDHDYDPAAKTPLLAVIGDSFVEAVMVPFPQTGVARLSQAVGAGGRVYGFGTSGSSLAQYLAYARYVRDTFHPDGLVVVIVGNDFDESLRKYKREPGLHYFAEQANGSLELIRLDRPVPWWRDLLAGSSLGMYLYVNLEIREVWKRFAYRPGQSALSAPRFIGNTAAEATPERVADSDRAVEAFLGRLPEWSGLAPSRIVLVLDGIRPELYEPAVLTAAEDSYAAVMRRHLMTQATAKGFEVIDLQPRFMADYAQRHQRFEFPDDNHWNGEGHAVFARAVEQSAVYRTLFGQVR